MSELQLDDPDPLPSAYEYSVNYQTDLAYDDIDLTAELAEHEATGYLSEAAKAILAVYGEGSMGSRHAYVEGAELHHLINKANKDIFTFIDTIDEYKRCRAWIGDGVGVSWCEEEQRYEPANDVMERLKLMFPITGQSQEPEPKLLDSVANGGLRLRRALAMAILR